MFSTRLILISIVFIVLLLVSIWSTSDSGPHSEQVVSSPKTKRPLPTSTNDEEEDIFTRKPSTKTKLQDVKISTEETSNQKKAREEENENEINDDDNDDKYWTSSQLAKNKIVSSSSISSLQKEISSIRQCKPLGKKFTTAVAKWLLETQNVDVDGEGTEEKKKIKRRRLIYSCESHRRGKFCGGMGDRFRGMVSSAFLALLSNRRYEIFHPVPVPLQQFLRPRYIDWIPRVRDSSSVLSHAKSFQQLDNHMQSINLHRELMNLKTHKKFIPYYLTPPATNSPENVDLRIQSNTPGFDKYILRDQQFLKKRFVEELGLPVQCNLTCYYGCMYGLLFEPSDELEKEMKESLKGFEVFDDQHQKKNTNSIPLSTAVVETHRGIRKKPVPILGLQVRVGGSWAGNFTAKEPFRTVPSAFPFIFQDVKVLSRYSHLMMSKGNEKNHQKQLLASLTTTSNSFKREFPTKVLPVFVTSDSYRFILEAEKALSSFGENHDEETKTKTKVFSISGDCFQHTDTQNVNEAIPEKYNHLNTKKHHRRAAYLCTLMNHVVLSASEVLVMGQSGFADTAFWSGRSYGLGFFMDMTNNKLAWEHTLEYLDSSTSSNSDDVENNKSDSDGDVESLPSPAVSKKNRIVDVTKDTSMVSKNPFFK